MFKLSLTQFYDNFIAQDAPFGLPEFFDAKGDTNIVASPWSEGPLDIPTNDEEGINIDETDRNERAILSRKISMQVKVTGVPFLSSSRYFKYHRIVEKSDTKVVVEGTNKTPDVPYSGNFYVFDRWVIMSVPNGDSCIYRSTVRPIFVKDTIFKNKITGRVYSDTKEIAKVWYSMAKK